MVIKMWKPITKFRYYTNVVLPLTYSDALSYMEDLSGVINKLNDVITSYNELINYYNSLDDVIAEVNDKLKELDEAISKMQSEIDDAIANMQAQINQTEANLTAKIDSEIAKNDARFSELEKKLTDQISTQLAYINEQIILLKADFAKQDAAITAKVDKMLNDFIESIPDVQNVLVVNPITGKLDTIQNVINYMYEYQRCEALTAWEYDCLGMTAEEYDKFFIIGFSIGLTANQYDWYGKTILSKYRKHNYYDAISGKLVTLNNKVDDNTDLLKASGSFTASEYDKLELTAQQYDNLDISAYTYDWHMNQVSLS